MNQLHAYFRQRKHIYAPKSVHKKIAGMVSELPDMEPVSLPLFWAKPAFVMAGILFMIALSGGMVVAAQASKPGSPLFPIKKAIVQAQIALTKDALKKDILKKEIEEPSVTPIEKNTEEDEQKIDASDEKHVSGGSTDSGGEGQNDRDDHTNSQVPSMPVNTSGGDDGHKESGISITPTPTPHENGSSGGGSGGSGNNVTPSPTPIPTLITPTPTKTDDGGSGK